MLLPAAHLLHGQGYRIDWICGPSVAGLLGCYGWIHPIVVEERAVLQGSVPQRVRALTALWRSIVHTRYDLCATLYYDRRWQLLTMPVRARRRLSLSRTDRDRRIVPSRHHSDEFARILLGLPDTHRETSLAPLRPDSLPGSPLPAPAGLRVALVPGGASNVVRQQTLRRWPVERYADLADALLQRGCEVVLLGGPDDVWVRDAMPRHPRLLDALGTLTLPEVIAAADTCDLVITHDTGPLHLAGLSRAPLLALFGPTDPGSFLPRRPGIRVLWGGETFACRPCYDGRDFAPCPRNTCMESLGLAQVLAAADAMLSHSVHPAVLQGNPVEPEMVQL